MALRWWARAVGALYLLVFVAAAIAKAPIAAEGPPGVLIAAAAGDALARFVVDTWVTLGLIMAGAGVGVLVASRNEQLAAAVWMVTGIELAGMAADLYKIARGYDLRAPVTWLLIHAAVVGSGWICLRRDGR